MQHHEGRETHSLTNNPFADFRPPTWLRTLSLSLVLIPLTTLRVSCSSSQDEGTGGSDWGVLSGVSAAGLLTRSICPLLAV